MGTMALMPQVVDTVRLPVVAAGGIGDARGIVAAFAFGAEGVQRGTVFLHVRNHCAALLSGQAKQTALTRGFTGRLDRGIKNRLLDVPIKKMLKYCLTHFNGSIFLPESSRDSESFSVIVSIAVVAALCGQSP